MLRVRSGCHVKVEQDKFNIIGHEKDPYLVQLKENIPFFLVIDNLNSENFVSLLVSLAFKVHLLSSLYTYILLKFGGTSFNQP